MLRRPVIAFGLAALGWLPVGASAAEPSRLEGWVRQNGERGPALAGVQILAGGASPGASDSTGRYLLQFPRKRPGAGVLLEVSKAGFEVVNWPHLQLNLPEHPALQPLHIFLCAVSACEEIRTRFFLAASLASIEAENARQIRALESRGQADARELAKLREELELARKGAEQAARALAILKPAEITQANREAFRLLLSGQSSEVLRILDKEKLREQAKAVGRRANEEFRNVILGYELRSAARRQQLDPEGAEAELRDAVADVPQSAYGWLALGIHLAAQNRDSEAAPLFAKGLERARGSGDDWAAGALANNLGNALAGSEQYAQARRSLQEALDLYRAPADASRRPGSADLAMVLGNLGALDAKEQRFDEARKHFEAALETYRELALLQPEAFLPLVAGMLGNLGNLDNLENRVPKARERFAEALGILQKLVAGDRLFTRDLANVLDNFGVLEAQNGQSAAARDHHLQALALRRSLTEADPGGQKDELAVTLNNVGAAQLEMGQLAEASAALEEAEALLADQLRRGRIGVEEDLAGTRSNLAKVNGDMARLGEAIGLQRAAVETFGRLAAQNPDVHLPSEAGALNNLGRLLASSGQLTEAIAAFESSRARYLRLEQRAPHVFGPEVAMPLTNLAGLYGQAERPVEALEAGRQAECRLRQAMAANPSRFGPRLAQTLHNLGLLQLSRFENAVARSYLEEAVLLRRRVAAEDPSSGSARRQLPETLLYLGMLESFDGNVVAARKAFDEVEKLAEGLEAERPGSARDLLEGARGARGELPASAGSEP